MREIIMVGPSLSVQGGMRSVVDSYRESAVFKKNKVHYIPTFIDAPVIPKIAYFILGTAKCVIKLSRPSVTIVHIHTATRGSFLRKSIILLLARLFGKRAVMHVHGAEFNEFYESSDALKKSYIKAVLSRSVVVALSERWKKDLERMTKPGTTIKVIYNPVSIPKAKRRRSRGGRVKFLFLGRIGTRKGTYDLIRAVQRCKSRNISVIIAGDGEVEKAASLVKSTALQDRIRISGWVRGKEKEDLLESCDAYILPSYNEGLPVSVLEAMAHGLPIISTTVGGIPEAVENGSNGILIKPGDVRSLADAIDRLASNRALRERMGRESLRIAKAKFDSRKVAEQVNKLYAELER